MKHKPIMTGPWYAEVRRLPSDTEREYMSSLSPEEREELDSAGAFNLKQSKWFNDQGQAVAWTSMMLRYQGFHLSQVVPKSFRDNQERNQQEVAVELSYEAAISSIPEAEQIEYQNLTQIFLNKFMLKK